MFQHLQVSQTFCKLQPGRSGQPKLLYKDSGLTDSKRPATYLSGPEVYATRGESGHPKFVHTI